MRLFNPRRFGYGRPVPRPPLSAAARARLDAWVAFLDVDLELAQRMLRLPPDELPPVPAPPASADGPADVTVVAPPPAPAPRGAYARRAAGAGR